MYVFLNFSCAFLGLPQNLAAGFQDHVGREREGGRKRRKEAGREKGNGKGRESGRKREWEALSHFWLRSCRSSHLPSVQFSRSVMSDCDPMNHSTPGLPVHHQLPEFTQTHDHPAIWSSVIPFSSCPQSLPASGSFPMSQLFSWGGQSIGVSASTSVLPMNTQDWSLLGWTGWISFVPRNSQESSPIPQFKSIHFSVLSFLHSPTLTPIHDHWKNHSLD